MSTRRWLAGFSCLAGLMVVGCGSSGSSSSRAGAPGAVGDQIRNYAFIPPKLTVKAGTRLTFSNHDATAHTATATNGAFDTGTIKGGQSKTVILSKPGTYSFYCQFHAFMRGTVTVTG